MIINILDKRIFLHKAEKAGAPLVLHPTVQDEGEEVYREVRRIADTDFNYAAIGNINWNDEMSPWPVLPVIKGDEPFTGGADSFLEALEGSILPGIINILNDSPKYVAFAGYSLSGLCAVYSMYRSSLFRRIASASGSFWYPGFPEYAKSHELKTKPEKLYFSLGDKEAKTKNALLGTVRDNTEDLERFYRDMGIETIFELNPGNHFKDANERMAKAIAWILAE